MSIVVAVFDRLLDQWWHFSSYLYSYDFVWCGNRTYSSQHVPWVGFNLGNCDPGIQVNPNARFGKETFSKDTIRRMWACRQCSWQRDREQQSLYSVRTLPWCLLHTLVADRDVLPKLLMFSTESRMAFGSQLDVESVSLYGNILIVGRYAATSVKFLSAIWMPNIFQSWNCHESWMLTIIVPHRMRRKHRSTAPISPGNSLSLKRSECHSAKPDQFHMSKVATSSIFIGEISLKFFISLPTIKPWLSHIITSWFNRIDLSFHRAGGGGPLLDTAGKEAWNSRFFLKITDPKKAYHYNMVG